MSGPLLGPGELVNSETTKVVTGNNETDSLGTTYIAIFSTLITFIAQNYGKEISVTDVHRTVTANCSHVLYIKVECQLL